MTAASNQRIGHGNFTGLASNYSKFRPGYSEDVLSAIIGMSGKTPAEMSVADVGAGTGIWTRLMAARGMKSVTAVEPNDDMRTHGEADNNGAAISWKAGSAEQTTLADNSADILSMASSFHWADFDVATKEFARVLKDNGLFVALWNPRYIKDNPMLVEIEDKIYEMAPHVKRVSSGSSAFVETLTARFANHPLFHPPVYIEGRHVSRLSRDHYIGVWESVNDIRSQMGEDAWAKFMDFVKEKTSNQTHIDCSYLTRAWVVRKKS